MPGIRVKGTPVTLDGVTYPSLSAAARERGVNPTTMVRAYHNGTEARCGRVGIGMGTARPLIYQGRLFPTIAALAAFLGRSPSSVKSRIKRGTLSIIFIKEDHKLG